MKLHEVPFDTSLWKVNYTDCTSQVVMMNGLRYLMVIRRQDLPSRAMYLRAQMGDLDEPKVFEH